MSITRFKDVENLKHLVNYDKNTTKQSKIASKNFLKNLEEVHKKTNFALQYPKDKKCPLINFKMLNCDFHYQDGTAGSMEWLQ